MNKNLASIVSLIHKIAGTPDPESVVPPVAAPTGKPSGGGTGGGTYKPKLRPLPTNNVGKMQTAMLNFANVVQSTDVTAFETKYDKDRTHGIAGAGGLGKVDTSPTPKTPQSTADWIEEQKKKPDTKLDLTEQKERSGGTNPVGHFLMNNYVKTQGHQYATVDMIEEQGRETQGIGSIEAKDLRGLVATIKQLGTPGPIVPPKPGDKKPVGRGENVPDGIWDIRTNNSLKNIAALIGGVLNFTKDIGKTIQGYNQGDLNEFVQFIPKDPDTISKEDKETIAADYLQHINAMTKFYENFKTQVLENQSYKKLMTQQDAFSVIKMDSEKVKPTEKLEDWIAKSSPSVPAGSGLLVQSKNYYEAYKDKSANPKFFGVEAIYDNVPMRFNYAQLSDVNAFKARIKEYLKREPTQNDINGVFDDIKRVVAANTAVETDELKTGKMPNIGGNVSVKVNK